jgi:predicted nuclease of predicted toxin-antitoxin system
LSALGFNAQDARDIGSLGRSDEELFQMAAAIDAIIITRDRGFYRTTTSAISHFAPPSEIFH